MIDIQPIVIRFFGTADKVQHRIEVKIGGVSMSYLDLYEGNRFIKTLEQSIPADIYNNWGMDDTYITNWMLQVNGIMRAA